MPLTYTFDAINAQPDPQVDVAQFNPGSHTAAHASPTGQELLRRLSSRAGVAMLVGSVRAAPSRPAVVATETLVEPLGTEAFTDDMKKYAGRVVRFVIEQVGGHWVRRGVKVIVRSNYGSGSIYTFDG